MERNWDRVCFIRMTDFQLEAVFNHPYKIALDPKKRQRCFGHWLIFDINVGTLWRGTETGLCYIWKTNCSLKKCSSLPDPLGFRPAKVSAWNHVVRRLHCNVKEMLFAIIKYALKSSWLRIQLSRLKFPVHFISIINLNCSGKSVMESHVNLRAGEGQTVRLKVLKFKKLFCNILLRGSDRAAKGCKV